MVAAVPAAAVEISGKYLETRTCQVYTGPCFANSEIGLTGEDAIMAWQVSQGQYGGVDLSGLNVVVVLTGSDTLAFGGVDDPREMRSVVFVDDRADDQQRDALVSFARQHAGRAGEAVVKVESMPITMSLDEFELKGQLEAGKCVKMETRAARQGDCICSNERAYYPPLAKVENFAPGVTTEGWFSGRGLGSRWSTPNSRSAYMATFAY
jgi:hypothetical protein